MPKAHYNVIWTPGIDHNGGTRAYSKFETNSEVLQRAFHSRGWTHHPVFSLEDLGVVLDQADARAYVIKSRFREVPESKETQFLADRAIQTIRKYDNDALIAIYTASPDDSQILRLKKSDDVKVVETGNIKTLIDFLMPAMQPK